jgi:hypothetical protein
MPAQLTRMSMGVAIFVKAEVTLASLVTSQAKPLAAGPICFGGGEGFGLVEVEQDDGGTALYERLCDSQTNAAGRSGDDGALLF